MRRRGPTNTTFAPRTLSCRVLGCRFGAESRALRWRCQRGCRSGGEKTYPDYPDAEQAQRMAVALDRELRGPANVLAVLGGTLHRDKRG